MSSASVQPILALLGFPLAGNPTQYMLEKAFQHHGLDWRYLSLEVAPEDLGDAVRGLRVLGFSGGNCAAPHKETVLEHLDGVGRTAELAGVVNCILRDEGGLVGENTEGKAMLAALRRRIDPKDKRIVLFGAGRIARAIAVELAEAGVAGIVVASRSEDAGRDLVDLLHTRLEAAASLAAASGDYQLPEEADVIINATSIGSDDPDARLPLDYDTLGRKMLAADVITDPPRTHLIREARQRGCQTVDGLEVFVGQAVINLKLWTGVDADAAVMSDAVEEFLEI